MIKNNVELKHILDDLMNFIKREGIDKINIDFTLPGESDILENDDHQLLTNQPPSHSNTSG